MKREVPPIARQLLRLLLITFVWWHSSTAAQPSASFQQYYYYYNNNSPLTFAPIINYTFENSLYLEGRYNYEDINTASLYVGKTFEHNSALSISFTPIAGAVLGFYKGASIGANLYMNYKRLNMSHQPQYTFSSASREGNFLYSWSDLSLDITDHIAIGVSAQHTKMYFEKGLLEKGVMLQFSYKRWSLPIYTYNPESAERYFLIGLNYEWEGKKRRKRNENTEPEISGPGVVLAKENKTQEKQKTTTRETQAVPLAVSAAGPVKSPAAGSKDGSSSLFALIAGSFTDLRKAEVLRDKILHVTNKQVSIYPENGVYRVRMTGFANRSEAENFRTEVLGNLSAGASVIYAYRVQSLQMDLVEKAKGL